MVVFLSINIIKMSEADLIHLKGRGDIYSDFIRSKSHIPSEKRSESISIAMLKYANPDNLEKKALALISNPDATAFTLSKLATELLEMDLTPKLKINLLSQLCKLFSTVHGTRQEITELSAREGRIAEFNEKLKSWYSVSEEAKEIEVENIKLKSLVEELQKKLYIYERNNEA